ncbi:glucosaminidase domain-containing protein [Bacillus sp. JJ1764]|uniref:glucosaminidase domain-containing protein n=1 Tax=Bacillus sp. JJ1764 TaxID=3122964 RepID=UPI002FFFCD61
MLIGDDWFTKTMLINTLARTEKLRSQLTTISQPENLFSDILSQLLSEKDTQTDATSKQTDSISNMLMGSITQTPSTQIPNMLMGNITPSINEPLQYQDIQSEKIDQVLGGKLSGMGEVFVQAGRQYNLNPALLAAIAQHESGNGSSRASHVKNNIAGMMGSNGLKSYGSIGESIMDMARNLSKNYLGKGLNSISEIGAKYAPIGATNDPTGLNNNWVKGVTRFFNKLLI